MCKSTPFFVLAAAIDWQNRLSVVSPPEEVLGFPSVMFLDYKKHCGEHLWILTHPWPSFPLKVNYTWGISGSKSTDFKMLQFHFSPFPQKPLHTYLLNCTRVNFPLLLFLQLKLFLLRCVWSFTSSTIMVLWSKTPPQVYQLIQPISVGPLGFPQQAKRQGCPFTLSYVGI